ncbi:hypothetical protein Tsubulata_049234 [Turnera subulata]|uniref:CRAL-TRIO domain-containing protein n=1 Tax=Turnera subulata TaxID=218843 RepID=A0A9Q0F8W7_9ROSI|nr:hypothetical protein Tsubulata_049234 [Turnera subulata]
MKTNEIEQTKLVLMRALVEKQDPSSKEVDDLTIRRFLRDRDLDVEKASSMFLKFQKWRKSFVPNGSISPVEIPNELAHDKIFLQGSDKEGRPIAVVFGARHLQNKDLEEFKRFVVYTFDKITARIPPGQEKFDIIVDLEGCGFANLDVRGYIVALSILQDYYPESLEKLFILHSPSYVVVKALWKAVSPFLHNKTKKKLTFVEDKKIKSTLLKYIEESQIPEKYGGKQTLVPFHEA